MGLALGAVVFFAASAITGKKLSVIFTNGAQVNMYRLSFSALILGFWAIGSGNGLFGSGWWMLWFSGVIGFGLGDVGLFFSLQHLGARLTVMMIHCMATPIAAFLEWAFLGTTIGTHETIATVCLLSGVILSLWSQDMPNDASSKNANKLPLIGWLWGFIASLGQAGGAVMSRIAYQDIERADVITDPASVAWIRITGGVVFSMVFLWCSGGSGVLGKWPKHLAKSKAPSIIGLICLNGFLGPAAGVSFFQWALLTTPTALVLPVVALTPILLIPLSSRIDGIKPSILSIIGGVVAVISVVVLGILRS